MKRFCPVALVCLLLITLSSQAAPPNILLILADDCTCHDLETYGGQARTPRLNKFAAEGMLFTKCYQATAMCSPTRHSLYTGLYPIKSGGGKRGQNYFS